MNNTSSEQYEPLPRLVIIVSDGPLMVGRPEKLSGRASIYMPVASSDLPLPVLVTTIVTGVDATLHGIITPVTLDTETLKIRTAVSTDRTFPALWAGGAKNGIHTALIDWPLAQDDEDVTFKLSPSDITAQLAESPLDESPTFSAFLQENNGFPLNMIDALKRSQFTLSEMKKLVRADQPPQIIGAVLRNPMRGKASRTLTEYIQQEVESFLSLLSEDTNVLLVHKKSNVPTDASSAQFSFDAVFLVSGYPHEIKKPVFLKAIGGSTYALTGIPCPLGVFSPRFTFLPVPEDAPLSRAFPTQVTEDTTNWQLVIENLIALQKTDPESGTKGIDLLVTRFSVLSTMAYFEKQWDKLLLYSENLLSLAGRPIDYWSKILALHQTNNQDKLPEVVEQLNCQFPDETVTAIARSILLIDQSPEEAKKLLAGIELSEITIPSAIGTYGRLSIRADLVQQGVQALQVAIAKVMELPSDRVMLAQHFYIQEEFESALKALGLIGSAKGILVWRLLRLKIIVALQRMDIAAQLGASILRQYPANQEVKHILGKE